MKQSQVDSGHAISHTQAVIERRSLKQTLRSMSELKTPVELPLQLWGQPIRYPSLNMHNITRSGPSSLDDHAFLEDERGYLLNG